MRIIIFTTKAQRTTKRIAKVGQASSLSAVAQCGADHFFDREFHEFSRIERRLIQILPEVGNDFAIFTTPSTFEIPYLKFDIQTPSLLRLCDLSEHRSLSAIALCEGGNGRGDIDPVQRGGSPDFFTTEGSEEHEGLDGQRALRPLRLCEEY